MIGEFDYMEEDMEELSQRLSRSLGSPFGAWSQPANRPVAIAILSVYGVIFLTGLIGHVCVVAYTIASRKGYSNSRKGALLIIANLSSSHILFLLCCLPSIAYKSIMALTYDPWILGDIICRVAPFLEILFLGVTVLSFCVLSVDRLRSAGQITKAYDEAGDSCLTGVCKVVVIWFGALLIASPELFVHRTVFYQQRLPEKVFENIVAKNPDVFKGLPPRFTKLENPTKNWLKMSSFFEDIGLGDVTADYVVQENVTSFAVTYQYEKCEPAVSLWKGAPRFVVVFINTYNNIRQWWLFGFYFCLPVFFSLMFVLIVARLLTNAYNKCMNGSCGNPADGASGTLTSHHAGSLNRSNSIASNLTASSEAQHLMSGEHRAPGTPHNGSLRHHLSGGRSGSPAVSYPGMMTPMIVRASNNPLSTHHDNGNNYTQSAMSPKSPSVPYSGSGLSSPSMASAPYDVNVGNALASPVKSSSLPPHGRGSRGRGKMQKIILYNIGRDRALNTLLVALILAFSLCWLPQHIFRILFSKTQLQSALSPQLVTLINDICRYFSSFGFAVNPIVFLFAYKSYRLLLERFCCSCSCRQCC